ncbi:MAG: hypothetical protein MUO72_08880 [Bacteroidales bacterium]|nr:hypothetical protein [Bacteroidales bacterium]
MWCIRRKYRRSVRPSVVLALLFFDSLVYSQNHTRNDTINIIRPDKLIQLRESTSFFSGDTLTAKPGNLIPLSIINKDKSLIFFDSLKVKASKKLITRTLYDLIIVSNEPVYKKQITNPSDLNYLHYSGKKIRKIEIRQLGVFGSDINNPLSSDTNKINNLLNKTHINTNEIIIRKNLLFSEGDSVSPLTLSDNERIIRQLPYIDDARIIVVPVSDEDVDIVVLTRDVYSLGADFSFSNIKKGSVSMFEKNIFGFGHEFRLEIPYDSELPGSPGLGIEYQVDNIAKTFINLNLHYFDGLGKRTYGFDMSRKLISSTTKYAGGISVREMFTSEDLDTMSVPESLKYHLQDYWFSRSFLINRESVSRIIIGARYTNNNVFDHPFILPDSYHYLQKYKMFLGSVSYSIQKFYKTSLIYGYGRTEDIPYGALLNVSLGKEINEFKKRIYTGINLSLGESIERLGYFYISAGFATFLNENRTEQGLLSFRTNFISNLFYIGKYRIRNFVNFDYTRGFGRYSDEHLIFNKENGFSGFRNDSVGDNQRLCISLESVLFSPVKIYGFRCAFFGFADLGYLFGTNEFAGSGEILSGLGLGIRIRNDNLVLKTFQIRIGFFPNLPLYSKVKYLLVSGEQLLKPHNFEPGPPSLLPYN